MTSLGNRRDYHGTGVKKDIKRFPEAKQAGTGIDPLGSFVEFVRHDVTRNIDIHRDNFSRKEDLEARKNLVAIGCTKKQRPDVAPKTPVPYKITTDVISFHRPEARPLQTAGAGVLARTQFSKSNTSKEGWVAQRPPHTLNNCQSTNYNIINFQDNPNAVMRQTTNIDAKKHKGITEYADIMNQYTAKVNKDYVHAYNADPNSFKKRTGIFTHMYDAAARQGNIIVPFEKVKDLGGRPAFKI